MFRSIVKIIRLSAFAGVLGATAFLGYEYIKTEDRAHIVETVKTATEAGAQWTSEQTEEGRKAWQKLDIERKVDDLQDKAKPVGRKITKIVDPNLPSYGASGDNKSQMSLPALILIFVFGSVFVLMGRFSSSGRY